MKSLVVEDEFTSRAQLQRFLQAFGPCDVAVNGDEAILAYRKSKQAGDPYDLICLDIKLPGRDGHEILSEIREIEENDGLTSARRAKIFMTTALADYANISNSFRNLCDEYLKKPILKEKLIEILTRNKLIN